MHIENRSITVTTAFHRFLTFLLPFPVTVWYSWLKPFEYDLWIAILVTCNLVLFIVWWLDRKSPKGYYHILKDSDEDAFTLLGK